MPHAMLLLLGRVLVAALFVPAGFTTLRTLTASAAYFASLGFPVSTLVALVTGIFELAAGLLILVGFQTRLTALLLAAFSVSAGYFGHYGQGGDNAALVFMHGQALMKDIAIAGGLLALCSAGAGIVSIDGRRGRIRIG